MVRNPVLLVLVVLGVAGGAALGFVSHAPNRLLSGVPVPLAAVLHGSAWALVIPALVLLAGPFLPASRAVDGGVALASAALVLGLLALAGAMASAMAQGAVPAARTSLGAGFWTMTVAACLAMSDALRRLRLPAGLRVLAGAVVAAGVGAMLAGGMLAQIAVLREYANRQAAFATALERHLWLVGLTVVLAMLIGVPLGLLAHRRHGVRGTVFAILGVVQTIPSIALFGLLMEPLSGLSNLVPALGQLGISGVGMAPAVIALVLYALLPVVRNVVAGLDAVPGAALDAARGMGMSPVQIFTSVELPLALPVLLAGLRITLVQAIGLAAVAALIGAGGLGAIMFQGLSANALDLVLLGVLPIIFMAVCADTLMRLAVSATSRVPA